MSDELFTNDKSIVNIEDIVGEKGKFKTVEELAKAYANADQHIQNLKSINDELEKKNMSSKTIEDLMDVLNKSPANASESRNEQKGSETQTVSKDGIKSDDIKKVVQAELTAMEQKKAEEANLVSVKRAVEAKFKDRAKDEFTRMASEAGVTVDQLIELSKHAPAVVLKLISGTASTVSTGTGDMNTESKKVNVDRSLRDDKTYMSLLSKGKFREATAYLETINK